MSNSTDEHEKVSQPGDQEDLSTSHSGNDRARDVLVVLILCLSDERKM